MSVILCDYIGAEGGHSLKVLRETASLLKEAQIEPIICAPKTYEKYFQGYAYIRLPYNISFKYNKNRIKHYIRQLTVYFKYTCNFIKICTLNHTLWLTTVSFHFFVFLFFSRKIKPNLIATLYVQDYSFRFKKNSPINYFFLKSLSKIDYIVSTNESLSFNNKIIYLKDYYFSDRYREYLRTVLHKKDQIICLGTVNKDKKDIRGAIIALQCVNIPAFIIGNFQDKDFYTEVAQLNHNINIKIVNKNLPEEDYYSLMAESKYMLLPYYEEAYQNKTSGVLQECVFLKVIPITHKNILAFNQIEGIGYEDINEIANIDFYKVDAQRYQESYEYLINSVYNKNIFLEKIKKMINELEG